MKLTSANEAYSHARYVKALKGRIPPRAFAPSPRKLIVVSVHLAVILGSYILARNTANILVYAALCVIVGHSTACLGFLAHELSHGAIVRNRSVRYPIEVVLWGLNGMPATLWQRLHNYAHHSHGNTVRDPDRKHLRAELDAPGSWIRQRYTQYFFPHRFAFKLNPR
jgi:fatty acid desaturase